MSIVELLVADPRVIVNQRDSLGRTALMHVFETCNSIECARILLEHGADGTMQDYERKSCREYLRSEEMRRLVERWEEEYSTDRYMK